MGPARIMAHPPAKKAEQTAIMIDVSLRTPCTSMSLRKYAQGHRAASSLCVKGARAPDRAHQRWDEPQMPHRCRCQGAPAPTVQRWGATHGE